MQKRNDEYTKTAFFSFNKKLCQLFISFATRKREFWTKTTVDSWSCRFEEAAEIELPPVIERTAHKATCLDWWPDPAARDHPRRSTTSPSADRSAGQSALRPSSAVAAPAADDAANWKWPGPKRLSAIHPSTYWPSFQIGLATRCDLTVDWP